MGLLYGTVFALFYALFSLPLGRLADGWVRTRLLAIALAFWSLATALAGFAQGFALLALSRLGVGIGEGAAQPAGFSLVFDRYAKPRRGFATAVIAAAIALGLGGSSILGGWRPTGGITCTLGVPAPLGLKGWQFAFLWPLARVSSWRRCCGACPSRRVASSTASCHRRTRSRFEQACAPGRGNPRSPTGWR